MTTQPTQTIQEIQKQQQEAVDTLNGIRDELGSLNANSSADAKRIEQLEAQVESLEATAQAE
jgi:predicted  nucleic acid-binding Zn-ribbon protein